MRVAQFFECTIYYWIPHFIMINLMLYLFFLQRTIKIIGFRGNVCTYMFSRPVTFIVLYNIYNFEHLKFYFYFVCYETERGETGINLNVVVPWWRSEERFQESVLIHMTEARPLLLFLPYVCSRLVVLHSSGKFSCLWL